MLGNNGFFFKSHFGESNLMAGTYSYRSESDNVLDNYEDIVEFLSHIDGNDISVNQGDAGNLPYPDESVDVAVMDPPYGDNVTYAELADALYVWLREYLDDTFPEHFSQKDTNKEDEAVENPEFVTVDGNESVDKVARQRYENKMSEIFSEMYRLLDAGGVLTVYFTDKETKAWDSLTMGLINAGFSVSATHTITSEMPHRVGMQGNASADSTLLLTCRKPKQGEEHSDRAPTLWSDIRSQTRKAAREKAAEILNSEINLTKTDTIISAFGPTLQVFTENYPVVDRHDEPVRPKRALEEARNAVVEVLVNRELDDSLEDVDDLSTWYVLSWLVYGRDTIPYDDARQLGLGVGVDVDAVKSETKIWGKSGDKLVLKGQSYRVRDFTALEAGEKRRTRAYPVDPRDESFAHSIDALHAALNVLNTKGSDFTWNWLNERSLQDEPQFRRTVKSLLQVLPESHEDYELLINLVSGDTGDLLDIDANEFTRQTNEESSRTTLNDF
jgi:adenine-specific DNA methylase